MKCTARDIIDLTNAFAAHGGINLPAKVVLPFSRLQRAVKMEAETIGEAQQKLLDQHAAKDAEGKTITIKLPDGREDIQLADPPAFKAAIKQLMASEVEIPGEQFAADDLIRGEINSDLVAALHWAIKA